MEHEVKIPICALLMHVEYLDLSLVQLSQDTLHAVHLSDPPLPNGLPPPILLHVPKNRDILFDGLLLLGRLLPSLLDQLQLKG